MHAHVLIAICVLLATATDVAHGHLFRRWLTRGQLPAPCQHAAAAAASPDEAQPASILDTAWSKVANDKRNSVMYFVETKQELFLFGEAPAAPAPDTSTRALTTGTSAPATSTSSPATSTSAPATSTSSPATSTSAPVTSTSSPARSTSAPATSTRAPATNISTSSNAPLPSSTMPPATPAPNTSTSAPTTGTSVPATSTSSPATSTSAPATSTSSPATSTSAPATSTSSPATSTSAPATSTSSPATSTSAPATSTRAPATNISTSSNAPLPSSTMPPGYTYYAATGSAYKVYHEKFVSWYEANRTCAGEGAHVLVINDAREADIVKRIMDDADYWYTWTGLVYKLAGGVMEWRTVHGEPLSDVYHQWLNGLPTNDAGETCTAFSAYEKALYAAPCYESWYFTCEI